jgi:hypothetical protein
MLHLPSGFEILQACTQPTKVEDALLPVLWLFGIKWSYDDFNEFCPPEPYKAKNILHKQVLPYIFIY